MFSLIPEWLLPVWVTGMGLTSLWLTLKGLTRGWRWVLRRAQGELASPKDTLRAAGWVVGSVLVYGPAVMFWPVTVTVALLDKARDRRRRVKAAQAEEMGLLEEIRRAKGERGALEAGRGGALEAGLRISRRHPE